MPKLNADPQTTPGRCGNLDYCSIGMQRILVEIPVGKPFICPECGSRLRPPVGDSARRPWVLPAIRLAILLVGVGLGGLQGYAIGRMQPAISKAAAVVSHDTVDKVNAARALLGLPKVSADAIKVAPASPPPAAAPPAAATPPPKPAPAPFFVAERPFPRKTPAMDSEDPPQHLAEEQHAGQVVIDCFLGAIQARPSCHVGTIHGEDAFSSAAIGWLEGLSVQYAPGTRNGTKALLDHRWRVIFEDYDGTAAHPKPAR